MRSRVLSSSSKSTLNKYFKNFGVKVRQVISLERPHIFIQPGIWSLDGVVGRIKEGAQTLPRDLRSRYAGAGSRERTTISFLERALPYQSFPGHQSAGWIKECSQKARMNLMFKEGPMTLWCIIRNIYLSSSYFWHSASKILASP